MTVFYGTTDVPGIAIPTTDDGALIVPDVLRAAFLLYVGFSLYPVDGSPGSGNARRR